MKPCRRCAAKTVLSDEDISRMTEQVKAMRGIRLVDEEVYEKRIAVCRACEKLAYGNTCMLCGCVMQVRARLADGACPYTPKKWK